MLELSLAAVFKIFPESLAGSVGAGCFSSYLPMPSCVRALEAESYKEFPRKEADCLKLLSFPLLFTLCIGVSKCELHFAL